MDGSKKESMKGQPLSFSFSIFRSFFLLSLSISRIDFTCVEQQSEGGVGGWRLREWERVRRIKAEMGREKDGHKVGEGVGGV